MEGGKRDLTFLLPFYQSEGYKGWGVYALLYIRSAFFS